MSDTKLNRPDGLSATTTTNTQQQQQQQAQSQQTINFIPNYPYFLQSKNLTPLSFPIFLIIILQLRLLSKHVNNCAKYATNKSTIPE